MFISHVFMNVCFRTRGIRKITLVFKSLLETGMTVFVLVVVKLFPKQCLTDGFVCLEVIIKLVASPIHVVHITVCCHAFPCVAQRKNSITTVVMILPFQT